MSLWKKLLMAAAWAPRDGDTEWDQVVLSMHGDVSGPFLDVKGKTVTTAGNTALSTSTKKFGAGSIYFDGTGDYLTLAGGTDFTFATGDFTVEGWVNPSSVASTPYLIDFRSAAGTVAGSIYLSGGALRYAHTGTDRITGTTTLSTGQWYHFAVCRSNGTTRLFLNGVQNGLSYTDSTNYSIGTNRPIIGADQSGANGLNGYIDDLRITKGVARYTATFDVPTKANPDSGRSVDPYWSNVVLAMHMDGLDNGTVFHDEKGKTVSVVGNTKTVVATKKFGNSSAYFDGSGDYLSIADSEDWNFGTNDFTIEFWINVSVFPSAGQYPGLVSQRTSYTSNFSFSIYLTGDSGGRICFGSTTNGTTENAVSTQVINQTTGVWRHISFCRQGGTLYRSIDGAVSSVALAGGASYSIYNSTHALFIGRLEDAGNDFNGYIDDLRITKGIARYTADFSVPTRAFPRA